MRYRRAEEHLQPYYVDRFPGIAMALSVFVLVATMVDGLLTVYLVGVDCEEMNPVMGYLLHQGLVPFLLGKYFLTAVALPFLLIFKNHYLFGTRFRVGYLLPVIALLYLVLLIYQSYLCAWIIR